MEGPDSTAGSMGRFHGPRQALGVGRLSRPEGHRFLGVTVKEIFTVSTRRKDHSLMKHTGWVEIRMRLKSGVPAPLPELGTLGRTLNRRRVDVWAYFDHPGTHCLGVSEPGPPYCPITPRQRRIQTPAPFAPIGQMA